MVWLEEGLSGNLLTAAALLTGTYLLTRVSPDLGSLAASGVKLFVEAEFDMQDGLISQFASNAVDAMLEAMHANASPAHSASTAKRIIGEYQRTARRRSHHKGWNERDRRARYQHHVRKLKSAMQAAAHDLAPPQRALFAELSDTIAEDW